MSVCACKITSGTAESNASSKKLVFFLPVTMQTSKQQHRCVGSKHYYADYFFSTSDLAFRIYWCRTVGK